MKALRCPICQLQLAQDADQARCDGRHCFPVDNEVPNLLLSHSQTSDHYTVQWSDRFGYRGPNVSKPATIANTPSGELGWLGLLDKHLPNAARALDACCGNAGLADDILAAGFKGEYLGVDLNRNLPQVKRERFVDQPRFNFAVADVASGILPDEGFDLVLCRAALHHLSDPDRGLAELTRTLEPGGTIIFSIYRKKAPLRELADDYFRGVVSKLPPLEAIQAVEEFTLLGKLLSEAKAKVTVPQDLPLLGIPKGEQDIQRLVYNSMLKCFWNEDFGWDLSTLINYDWYHPQYAYRYTMDEALELVARHGLKAVETREVVAQLLIVAEKN